MVVIVWQLDLQPAEQSPLKIGVRNAGSVMVVIVWQLDLQPAEQSYPITTKVVSSNPDHGVVYSI